MDLVSRYVKVLEAGGVTLGVARETLQRNGYRYADEAIARWLDGRVIPGVAVRCLLLAAAQASAEDFGHLANGLHSALSPPLRPAVKSLCEAVRAGDTRRVRQSLERGVVIDGWDAGDRCALDYAVEVGRSDLAALLLAAGADPIAWSNRGTVYYAALESGSHPLIREFLRYLPSVPMEGPHGRSVLELVAGARIDDPQNLQLLWDPTRCSTVMLAQPLLTAIRSGNRRCALEALRLGAAPDAEDHFHVTALMEAAARGQIDVVRALFAAGAPLSRQDSGGNTALHHAAGDGNKAVITALIAAGCNPAVRNRKGQLPVDLLAPNSSLRRLFEVDQIGPRWFDPNGAPILFHYSKAHGLGFDPRSIDEPILFGGDYDGIRPTRPGYLLEGWPRQTLATIGAEWIVPFIEKLVHREDFALPDLIAAAHRNHCPPFTRSDVR